MGLEILEIAAVVLGYAVALFIAALGIAMHVEEKMKNR